LADDRPDVVLLDLTLGGMDGIETLRRIRQQDETLPVILASSQGQPEQVIEGVDLGIVDFVHKPVGVAQLAAEIRRLLELGPPPILREKTIEEIMVPVAVYGRVFVDEPLSTAVALLKNALAANPGGLLVEHGHRSILVFDRANQFVGLVHIQDVLAALVPKFLQTSPHATYYTGMFLAQAKMLRKVAVRDLVDTRPPVNVRSPLLVAVAEMLERSTINLPIAHGENIVGILRDRDLFFELGALLMGMDGEMANDLHHK